MCAGLFPGEAPQKTQILTTAVGLLRGKRWELGLRFERGVDVRGVEG
jgi:hypothetical protein